MPPEVENRREIKLKLENSLSNDKDRAYLYYLNMDAFKKAIDKLNDHQLEDVKVHKNKVSGTIDVDKNSTMFLSIPYEKGWNVYVDGKKVILEQNIVTSYNELVIENEDVIILNCYNTGDISCVNYNVGGICGMSTSRTYLYNCYNIY